MTRSTFHEEPDHTLGSRRVVGRGSASRLLVEEPVERDRTEAEATEPQEVASRSRLVVRLRVHGHRLYR